MNLRDIVKQQLETAGFDGLFNHDAECACDRNDLFPCGEPSPWCEPGYRKPCDCGEHDWHIARDKPSGDKE
jgi:hypothetical protein